MHDVGQIRAAGTVGEDRVLGDRGHPHPAESGVVHLLDPGLRRAQHLFGSAPDQRPDRGGHLWPLIIHGCIVHH